MPPFLTGPIMSGVVMQILFDTSDRSPRPSYRSVSSVRKAIDSQSARRSEPMPPISRPIRCRSVSILWNLWISFDSTSIRPSRLVTSRRKLSSSLARASIRPSRLVTSRRKLSSSLARASIRPSRLVTSRRKLSSSLARASIRPSRSVTTRWNDSSSFDRTRFFCPSRRPATRVWPKTEAASSNSALIRSRLDTSSSRTSPCAQRPKISKLFLDQAERLGFAEREASSLWWWCSSGERNSAISTSTCGFDRLGQETPSSLPIVSTTVRASDNSFS